jgi:hypothetical protein
VRHHVITRSFKGEENASESPSSCEDSPTSSVAEVKAMVSSLRGIAAALMGDDSVKSNVKLNNKFIAYAAIFATN